MGRCTALKELYLYDNQLTGIIPDELGNLTLLQKLYLDRNKLTGVLPVEIQKLSHLQILRIDNNELDDTENCKANIKAKVESWLPSFPPLLPLPPSHVDGLGVFESAKANLDGLARRAAIPIPVTIHIPIHIPIPIHC